VLSLASDQSNELFEWGVVIGASLVACFWDLRTKRIPNWLTLPLAALALAAATFYDGLDGLGEAAASWLVVALPFLIMFALGQGGAGDAKMMGAIGAWLGLKWGLLALVCVAITGALLAVSRVMAHRERKTVVGALIASIYVYVVAFSSGPAGWRLLKAPSENPSAAPTQQLTIPYGVAIFVGVCVAGVVKELL
jgi:Flp pilus assembly protein protease CpaA